MGVLTGVAYADVSPFAPPSGTMAPGGSTQTEFTFTPEGILSSSCLTATVSPNPGQFEAVNLDPPCVLLVDDSDQVTLTVTASFANTPPGDYVVTITETKLVTLGSDIVVQHTWPFTVETPTTTTSGGGDTTTTTTTAGKTTTTTMASSATSTPGNTTTSTPAATISTAGASATPNTGERESTGSTGPRLANGDIDEGGVAVGPADDGSGGANGTTTPEDTTAFETVAVSQGLRDTLRQRVPLPIADAVTSPLVIGEVLWRSLTSSVAGLVVPILLALLLGFLLVRRMRKEVNE